MAQAGAIFWPDLGRLARDAAIWRICRVPYRDEPEVEGGQVVVDKARCWKALQLTMHLNEHSDFYYRHVNGDKETFHMAWRMLSQVYAMTSYPARPLYAPGRAGDAWFSYVRVGSDERLIALRADGSIAQGSRRCERAWRVVRDGERACVEVLGEGFVTCRLARDADGVWRGQWRHFERMPVELVPLSPADGASLDRAAASAMGRSAGSTKPVGRAPAEPIDAVYLWVDGGDPECRETLSRYRQRDGSGADAHEAGAHCFRDNGELRFSLRSLETHAPWIRQIYLVTNAKVPAWLDLDSPRLSVIPHEVIFPDPSHLPTFNSHAVELHLHRIPGLSDRFLYLNADVFIGSPVALEDFLTPSGGQRIYLDSWLLPTRLDVGPVHDRAYAYNQRLLDERYGAGALRGAIAHTPQLFDRRRVADIQQMWRDEVARTSSHRFRAPDDVALGILYFYSLLEGPRGPERHEMVSAPGAAGLYRFVMVGRGDTDLARHLRSIASQRPKFFCLNDDRPAPGVPDPLGMQSRAFLHWYFRRPSSRERVGGRREP